MTTHRDRDPPLELRSDEAIARAALAAGVRVATSYPGSPGSGVLERILERSRPEDVHVEWSTNEKVALEVAFGASLVGRRAICCVKSVGFNVLLDTLMAANLTGVRAGLVIVLGDDPGAYGSQNDQDTRPIVAAAEVPIIEPLGPEHAAIATEAAFHLSEMQSTIVVLRITRSLADRAETAAMPAFGLDVEPPEVPAPYVFEPYRWVPYPANAVSMHAALHRKLRGVETWANASGLERIYGDGDRGVLAVGSAAAKLRDVLADRAAPCRVLELAVSYPLPGKVVDRFLAGLDSVLLLEENEPFVEAEVLRRIGQDPGRSVRVVGRHSGAVPDVGELFRWQIERALFAFVREGSPDSDSIDGSDEFRVRFRAEDEAAERPHREDHCAGCPYPEIVDLVRRVAEERGLRAVIAADPGCLAKASGQLDAKLSMGSAAAVVQGIALDQRTAAVAMFGDSSFFHLAIPAIVNAVQHEVSCLWIVLDNGSTRTTGGQPNPACGRDARGRERPRVSIEAVARACGVAWVESCESHAADALRPALLRAFAASGQRLLVVRATW